MELVFSYVKQEIDNAIDRESNLCEIILEKDEFDSFVHDTKESELTIDGYQRFIYKHILIRRKL